MIGMYNLGDLSLSNYYTLAIGIIDLNKKTIKYANCGHPSIYMIEDNELRELREGNFPIGLLSDKEFTYNEINYKSPVELLFFSDGLIEMDFDKRKGIEALENVLNRYTKLNVTDPLLLFIQRHLIDSNDRELNDDVTMTTVNIRVLGDE